MSSDEFGPEFELDVLAHAARIPRFRRRAVRILSDYSFTDPEHGWIFNILCQLGGMDTLTETIILQRVDQDFPDKEDTQEDHIRTALEIFKHRPKAPEYTLNQLGRFAKAQALQAGMTKAVQLLEKGRVEDAAAVLSKVSRERGIDYELGDWYTEFEERQASRREGTSDLIKVPTGFLPTFDRRVGGLESKELGLIIGTTGRGKSFFAANLAYWSALQGHRVVYISTEMDRHLVATRIDARWLGIEYDRIRNYDMSPEELSRIQRMYENREKDLKGMLITSHVPVRRCTIEVVEQILDDTEDEYGCVHLLVFDSADHLMPGQKSQSRRDKETSAYWEAKSLADERNIPVWTTTHAPKDVVNKIATAENVGESYDKSRTAAVVLTLNQSKADYEEGLLKLFVAKNRQGQGRFIIPIRGQFALSHFEEDQSENDEDGDEDDDE